MFLNETVRCGLLALRLSSVSWVRCSVGKEVGRTSSNLFHILISAALWRYCFTGKFIRGYNSSKLKMLSPIKAKSWEKCQTCRKSLLFLSDFSKICCTLYNPFFEVFFKCHCVSIIIVAINNIRSPIPPFVSLPQPKEIKFFIPNQD